MPFSSRKGENKPKPAAKNKLGVNWNNPNVS